MRIDVFVLQAGRVGAGLVLAALVGGCSSVAPDYQARFGEAVRASRQAQVIHPQGQSEPAQGLDGPAAREAMQRYRDSFKTPPPVVNVIHGSGTR